MGRGAGGALYHIHVVISAHMHILIHSVNTCSAFPLCLAHVGCRVYTSIKNNSNNNKNPNKNRHAAYHSRAYNRYMMKVLDK